MCCACVVMTMQDDNTVQSKTYLSVLLTSGLHLLVCQCEQDQTFFLCPDQWRLLLLLFLFYILYYVFHQAFQSQPRGTPAAWTQLFPLWPTAVASMALFTLTWWRTASRPSTVPGAALKDLMVRLIIKEPRQSRYTLSLSQRPRHSVAGRHYHGKRPYVPSPRWVCWGSHGKRTTASKVNSGG